MQKAVVNRVGQCILTCPTTACYNGLPVVKDKSIRVGGNLRFFGDGLQFSKKLEGRRYWRLPVMDGEFICEDVFGTVKGVAGGNFLILGAEPGRRLWRRPRRRSRRSARCPASSCRSPAASSAAAARSAARTRSCRPAPTTPTARRCAAWSKSALPEGVNAVYEIVIDGLDLAAVEEATRVGVRAACRPGVLQHHRRQLRRQARAASFAFAQVAGVGCVAIVRFANLLSWSERKRGSEVINKHDQNQTAYQTLRDVIDSQYPAGQFVAIDGGRVIADAESFDALRSRIQALGKIAEETFIVQARASHPQQVVIFLSC